VIHALVDQQDQRKMGSLVLFNPETYSLVLLGSLSLMAFPFLTGFYSKDLLLEIAIIPRNATILIGYLLILLAALASGYWWKTRLF
jgi:NADH-ubiquinone oxidoreductase chain 5